jgi:hypothetical protein
LRMRSRKAGDEPYDDQDNHHTKMGTNREFLSMLQ